MIEIRYGQSHSDATCDYIVTIDRPMTLGEFICFCEMYMSKEEKYESTHDDV